MRLLLLFVFVVVIGAMWETNRDRPQKAAPLLALCVVVTVLLFTLQRLV